MPAIVEAEKCEGCGDCVPVCPQNCIDMTDGKAVTRQEECIDCNACADACTHAAIKME